METAQISEILMEVADSASSSTWTTRHGSILALSSMFRYNAAIVCASPLFTSIVDCLKSSLKDEKVCHFTTDYILENLALIEVNSVDSTF